MNAQNGGVGSILFGASAQVGASRGLAELCAGRPVLVAGRGETLAVLPVEGLDADRLAAFAALCAPTAPRLVITARRAFALGLEASAPVALPLTVGLNVDTILALVADVKAEFAGTAEPAGPAAIAAIELVKLAQMLPAVLVVDAEPARATEFAPAMVIVEAETVAQFREHVVRSVQISGEAQISLGFGVRTRFVVFRDMMGDSPIAIFIGTPDLSRPVPVRLHSACLTGDVFGSRRCDCGDQLKLAITRLEAEGGGIILYLAQEGRGVGLANKMRTYQLQDLGLDTIDANTTLGFDDDERRYDIAARMLQMLGCTRVVLLTNNPAKLDGLTKGGIEVTGRIPIETPINADNRRYLTAKVLRAGHRLDHLIALLDDTTIRKVNPLAS
jgi:GTP cyclohydrolase II